jgi:hypothetical protein
MRHLHRLMNSEHSCCNTMHRQRHPASLAPSALARRSPPYPLPRSIMRWVELLHLARFSTAQLAVRSELKFASCRGRVKPLQSQQGRASIVVREAPPQRSQPPGQPIVRRRAAAGRRHTRPPAAPGRRAYKPPVERSIYPARPVLVGPCRPAAQNRRRRRECVRARGPFRAAWRHPTGRGRGAGSQWGTLRARQYSPGPAAHPHLPTRPRAPAIMAALRSRGHEVA